MGELSVRIISKGGVVRKEDENVLAGRERLGEVLEEILGV
jgi:hypothetical protein